MIQTIRSLTVIAKIQNEDSAFLQRIQFDISHHDLSSELVDKLLEMALPEIAPDQPAESPIDEAPDTGISQ